MFTNLNLTGGSASFGSAQFSVSASPLGAVLFVSSITGADTSGRLKYFGSPAASSVTGGTIMGPQGDPTAPLASVFGTNGALSYCKASRGDLIVVMPGHLENLSVSASYPMVAGVSILGLGYQGNRPAFTFTGGTATVITPGAGCQIQNCLFDLTGFAAVVKGFNLTGVGFQLVNCRVLQATVTNQAANAITVAANDCWIVGCDIDATAAAGSVTGVASGAAAARLNIHSSQVRGDYSTAPLYSTSTFHLTNMLLNDNVIIQLNGTAKVVINFTTSSTGIIRNNSFYGQTWSTAADAVANSSSTSLRWFQNFGFDNGAGVVSGVLVPAAGTIS